MSRSLGLLFCWIPFCSAADDTLIAVAANFADVGEVLAREYQQSTGHTITISLGSTGKLYAQIVNGAPFDALLAADSRHPALLEESGHAVAASRFAYALGRLTLWTAGAQFQGNDGVRHLRIAEFRKLAIANPALAPYGVAAIETMTSLGVLESLEGKLVFGENVGQAYALVATQNADLGFVAMSQVVAAGHSVAGRRWDVPHDLHTPIVQEAVLLQRGQGNAAALGFLKFLKSDSGQAIVVRFGYGLN